MGKLTEQLKLDVLKLHYNAMCIDEFSNIWVGTYTKSADIIQINTISRQTKYIVKGGKGYDYCNFLRTKNGYLYARFENSLFLKIDTISEMAIAISQEEFYGN